MRDALILLLFLPLMALQSIPQARGGMGVSTSPFMLGVDALQTIYLLADKVPGGLGVSPILIHSSSKCLADHLPARGRGTSCAPAGRPPRAGSPAPAPRRAAPRTLPGARSARSAGASAW